MGIRRATLTIQVYAHLFSCSNCSSFAPGSSFRLLPAFFQQAHPFQAHPYFLVPQDVPGSACIFSCPSSGTNHFSKGPWLLMQAHIGDGVGSVPDTTVTPVSQ